MVLLHILDFTSLCNLSCCRNLLEYSVGSEDRLELDIEVFNDGEDAYEANFYLELPESVNYVKTELRGTAAGGAVPPVLCSAPSDRNGHTLKCDLGNPMVAGGRVAFSVLLQPTVFFLEDVSAFPMQLTVNSSNPDSMETLADNTASFSLPVRVKTDLRVRGLPVPTLVTYNRSSYSLETPMLAEEDLGPEVTHVYQVENRGPSDIEEAEVYILWPSMRGAEEPLLYLTNQPQVTSLRNQLS